MALSFELRRRGALAVCFALVAATLSAAAPQARAATPSPIKIGAVLSYSGLSAPLGQPQVNALKLAEKDINAHGGVDGHPVQFDIVDDGAKADVAAQLAQQQLGSGAVAVMCGTRTDTSIAVSRVTGAANALQFYMTPTAGVWQTRGGVAKTVFQATPRDALEAQALLNFAKGRLHAKSIAILHDQNLYGTGGATVATEEAKPMGITIVANESYPGDATDFTPQIVKIRDAKPDAVILWGATQTPALAVRAARTLGLKVPILGSSGVLSPAIIKVAGDAATDVYAASNIGFGDATAQQKALAEQYEAAYHQPLVGFAAQAWDAAHLIVDALRDTHGKADGLALAAALEHGKPIAGVQGTFRFSPTDHNGLNMADVHIATARGNAWVAP